MIVPRRAIHRMLPGRGVQMLFVHPPKCGGSFVQSAFGRRGRKCISVQDRRLRGHLFWTEYRDRLPELGTSIDAFYTFSIMRNPFAWRVSFFEYVRNDPGGRRSGLPHLHAIWSRMTFSEYLDWLVDPATPSTLRFRPTARVSDWFTDEQGHIAVDCVLRQERLAQDLSDLRNAFGLLIDLPTARVNQSVSGDWRRYYSDTDVEKVASLHDRDLALFDYHFDPIPQAAE